MIYRTAFVLTAVLFLVSSARAASPEAVRSDQGLILHVPSSMQSELEAAPTRSLDDFLDYTMAYDRQLMKIEKSVIKDGQCGDVYFLDFKVRGFWSEVQAELDFYVQTLTRGQQERLYDAIKKNYPTKGLPKCLRQDQFEQDFASYSYHYDPDFTTVNIPVASVAVPAGYPCAGQVLRPLTSCWDIKDPYLINPNH